MILPRSTAPRLENCFLLLLVKPSEEFLKSFVTANFCHRIEVVAEFVMRPGLVNEIFATVARGRDLVSTLAARHDMMPARGDVSQAKHTVVIHRLH